jgi:hypothetical protein
VWNGRPKLTIKFVPFTKLVIIVVSRELSQISNQKLTWWARRKRSYWGFLGSLDKSIADSSKRESGDSNYQARFDVSHSALMRTELEQEGTDMRKGSDYHCGYPVYTADRLLFGGRLPNYVCVEAGINTRIWSKRSALLLCGQPPKMPIKSLRPNLTVRHQLDL